MSKYEDIIELEHHVSQKHRRMSALERAAQFMPFSALSGYETLVNESVRERKVRPELSDSDIEDINQKLSLIRKGALNDSEISLRHVREIFGGSEVEILCSNGSVTRIDPERRLLTLNNETVIFFDDILSIEL